MLCIVYIYIYIYIYNIYIYICIHISYGSYFTVLSRCGLSANTGKLFHGLSDDNDNAIFIMPC